MTRMTLRQAATRVYDWNVASGQIPRDLAEGLRSEDMLSGNSEEAKAARELTIKIIQEEVDELAEALEAEDEVETLDAVCDIIFTTLGAAAKAGVWDIVEAGFKEVCRSNDSKLDGQTGDGKTKFGKGPNYTPPNLHEIVYGSSEQMELDLDDDNI